MESLTAWILDRISKGGSEQYKRLPQSKAAFKHIYLKINCAVILMKIFLAFENYFISQF